MPFEAIRKKLLCNVEKIEIGSAFLGIYLLYVLAVIGVEWINFLLAIAGIKASAFGLVEVTCISLIMIVVILHKRYFRIKKISISWDLCVGIILILICGCLTSVYPDRGHDTYNYHLIAQNPQFRNYFDDQYFGYGRFEIWGFRLGDRLFYYFRILLGFRMGTILNTFVLALIFIQICQLLDLIDGTRKKNTFLRICTNKCIWAIAILFYTQSLLMFASYYVDILAIPIELEVLRVLLKDAREKVTSRKIAYFALLCGICIGVKLTNIVYVLPFAILFLLLHYKDIRIRDWFVIFFIGVYPFAVYLINNFIYTGNPVFPYFNALFKSIYFPFENFKDERWGGITDYEKFFWTVYAAFKPGYRQAEIGESVYPVVLIIGLIGSVYMLLCTLISVIKGHSPVLSRNLILLMVLTLMSSFLWAYTTGYSRYFILGRILWGLIAYCFVSNLLNQYQKVGGLVSGITIMLAVICVGCNVKSAFIDGVNWSWTMWRADSFLSELKHVFRDRRFNTGSVNEVNLFFLTDIESQGIAELLDNGAPVINAKYANYAETEYQKVFGQQSSDQKQMTDLHKRPFYDISEYIDGLNTYGVYATKFEILDTYLGYYEAVSVVPSNDKLNTCWETDQGVYELPVNSEDREFILSFIAGRYFDWSTSDPIVLKIFASNGLNERELSAVAIDNLHIEKFSLPIELSTDENSLVIRAYQSNDIQVSDDELNKAFILNAHIE